MTQLLLTGGHGVHSTGAVELDVLLQDGQIEAVGQLVDVARGRSSGWASSASSARPVAWTSRFTWTRR